jgi:hypothetical protein
MQAALDAAALIVSKDLFSGIITPSQVRDKAQAYFSRLHSGRDAKLLSFSASYTAEDGSMGSTVQLTSTGQIQTDFMKIVNFPTMNFGANSTAARGQARLGVAMAIRIDEGGLAR